MFQRIYGVFYGFLLWILALFGLGLAPKYNDLPPTDVAALDSEELSEAADESLELQTVESVKKHIHSVSVPGQPRLLLVMRHGHRQDEENPSWSLATSRPWDPPLSTKGRSQARNAVGPMSNMGVDYVVVSPFLRCLQTSAEIVKGLGLRPGCWQVDWGLAEVCSARNMSNGNTGVMSRLKNGSSSVDWMWEGLDGQGALQNFIQDENLQSRVGFKPIWRGSTPPVFPESLEGALSRYERCLQALAQEFEGFNVLVVGHGECMRQAVKMMEPDAEVYEVVHTGYVLLQRDGGADTPWQLGCASGETGVSWFT